MIKSIKILLVLLPIVLCFVSSCKKSDDNSNPSISNPPSSGKWKITYFFDKQDLTSSYTSFTFEFGSTGSLLAANGSQTWSGTWLTNYDDSANKFLIDFSGSVPSSLSDLEEDWRIVTMEDNYMRFEHNGGTTDVLEFKK